MRSKRADEFDLRLGKWIHFGSHQREDTNHCPFTQERNSEVCPKTERFLVGARQIIGVGEDVLNMNYATVHRDPSNQAAAVRAQRTFAGVLFCLRLLFGREPGVRCEAIHIPVVHKNSAFVGPTKASG